MPTKSTPHAEVTDLDQDHYSTTEASRLLGLAVRSIQMMVDRGDLDAWRTPGGHRRISRESIARALNTQALHGAVATAPLAVPRRAPPPGQATRTAPAPLKILLIEDSTHFQNLVSLLLRQKFPEVHLQVANDGIVGLVTYGQWKPDVLIVDILLPGIDGATLITSLRTTSAFEHTALIVMTSLDESERGAYALALHGIPVVHKPNLISELPNLIAAQLARQT